MMETRAGKPVPARRAPLAEPPAPEWTPKIVGEQLVEAIRWAASLGPVGPKGFNHVRLAFEATLEEHLAEGWGLPEAAEDDGRGEDRPLRLMLPPAVVSRHRAALEWPAVYLCPDNVTSARMLGLWAACKAGKRSFDGAVKARGGIARAHAYRYRDRGLSLIAQGLVRDRVPVEV